MAQTFAALHEIPTHISDTVEASFFTQRLKDRIFAVGADNSYDIHNGTNCGQIVLEALVEHAGLTLLEPEAGPEKTNTITEEESIAAIVAEVTRALGPTRGTATVIGELLVEGSDILYVTNNFSDGDDGFGFLRSQHDTPTYKEPYLIIHMGSQDRQTNLQIALNAVLHGSQING